MALKPIEVVFGRCKITHQALLDYGSVDSIRKIIDFINMGSSIALSRVQKETGSLSLVLSGIDTITLSIPAEIYQTSYEVVINPLIINESKGDGDDNDSVVGTIEDCCSMLLSRVFAGHFDPNVKRTILMLVKSKIQHVNVEVSALPLGQRGFHEAQYIAIESIWGLDILCAIARLEDDDCKRLLMQLYVVPILSTDFLSTADTSFEELYNKLVGGLHFPPLLWLGMLGVISRGTEISSQLSKDIDGLLRWAAHLHAELPSMLLNNALDEGVKHLLNDCITDFFRDVDGAPPKSGIPETIKHLLNNLLRTADNANDASTSSHDDTSSSLVMESAPNPAQAGTNRFAFAANLLSRLGLGQRNTTK